jgi:hypothetical protein
MVSSPLQSLDDRPRHKNCELTMGIDQHGQGAIFGLASRHGNWRATGNH